MKTLYVIHHSHTDVGYTEMQSRVERWHVDFIRQALRIIESARTLEGDHFDGFRWQCEGFWAVERFLERASEREAGALAAAVRSGAVGLSGSYLNMNELPDFDLLSGLAERAADYGRATGVPVDSAMTADINGYSWGYSQALADNGIDNLFTCVHTHHGMYPLGRQQAGFWWESPRGERVLVWSGEHYHFGNELGIAPGAVSSYLTKDECDAETIFSDHWRVAETRVPRYLEKLEDNGYPFDFAPVMVSGLRTDNAPPSERVAEFIMRWNREHGDVVRMEMTTLSRFFARVREAGVELPTHAGDWPDWWSDGLSGNAVSTALFRGAQRDLRLYRRLVSDRPEAAEAEVRELENDLALYAEHTFGHAGAAREPWHERVHAIAERKKAYAALAHDRARDLLDGALDHAGAAGLAVGTQLTYRAVNPLGRPVSGPVGLPVGHYEFNELGLSGGADAVDAGTGDVLPCQLRATPDGGVFVVHVELEPGEEREFRLRPLAEESGRERTGAGDATPGESGICGAHASAGGGLETPFVRIEWRAGEGIVSWFDRALGRELLRKDRQHAPFTPVHEMTPVGGPGEICSVRGAMGLNRKGADAARTPGYLVGATPEERGDVFVSTVLDYGLTGAGLYAVELTAWMDEPRVDVSVRLHKDSVWQPENVYVALPFATGAPGDRLWLDKAGAPVRPRIDQIPGTLTDFYCVQGGLALVSGELGLAVATPDAPLIQVGPLEHGRRLVMGDPELADDPEHLYAWLMTNYWETNFAAELGGFYEFRFSVRWGEDLAEPSDALEVCSDMAAGILAYRLR
jgi:hypothetical protein